MRAMFYSTTGCKQGAQPSISTFSQVLASAMRLYAEFCSPRASRLSLAAAANVETLCSAESRPCVLQRVDPVYCRESTLCTAESRHCVLQKIDPMYCRKLTLCTAES